ncbi:Hint domain-containing protein [Flavimaricola sp.]|nr:Hint domain-containing protein [Flavimaricola sp.]MDA9019555.1 Hint domain-containing protein [Flavimaricola sp.]
MSYVVTVSNWNDPAFWASVSETTAGQTLDLSGLPDTYFVRFDADTNILTLSDGTTTFIVGDSDDASRDAQLGGTTQWGFFTNFSGTDGNDVANGTAGDDIFDGGGGADTLSGDDGSDTLSGGLGNDSIYGGNGEDNLSGGADNDKVYGGAENDVLYGGAGNDTLTGGTGEDTLYSGDGLDILNGEDGDDMLYGAGERATLNGGNGADSLFGGDGNDRLFGGADDDVTYGGLGNDELGGGTGNDLLDGGAGNDALVGWGGDDTLFGGEGADTLTINLSDGNDTFYGGESEGHKDLIAFGSNVDGVNVVMTGDESGTITGTDINVTFAEIEVLRLGQGNDTYDGSASNGPSSIRLQLGDDTAYGGSGNDYISGEGGDDVIYGGGAGNDTLSGGGGTDTLYSGDGVNRLNGEDGDDMLYGAGDRTSLFGGNGVDSLFGGDGNDRLDGGADDDVAYGGLGNDALSGGGGNDLLYGGEGKDALAGNDGNDELTGGAGNDVLTGGAGNDLMYGGEDRDVFGLYAGDGDDTIYGGEGGDDVDQLAVQNVAGGVNITLTGDEVGTVTGDGLTVAFEGIETFRFGGGNDIFDGSTSSQALNLSLSDGDDMATSGSGNDVLYGGGGNDFLIGGAGDDLLNGFAGDDTLYGGDGIDKFGDNFGTNTVYGGEGGDDSGDYLSFYGGTNNLVTLADDESGVAIGDSATTYFYGIEKLNLSESNDVFDATLDTTDRAMSLLRGDDTAYGGSGNDLYVGNAGNDEIHGNAGNDSLRGDEGDDTLYGGDGADILAVGSSGGSDTIFGGDGGADHDTLDLSATVKDVLGNVNVNVTLTGDEAGTAEVSTAEEGTAEAGTVEPDGTTVQFAGIEGYILGGLDDSFDGSVATQSLVVDSLAGNDTIFGGQAGDTITQLEGDSTLHGNGGDDSIAAGAGNDTVFGGDGGDTISFLINEGDNTVYGGDSAGDTDVLDLTGIADGVTVVMDTETSGTVTAEGLSVSFSGIEEILLAEGTSTIDRSALASDLTTNLEGGNDTFIGGSGSETVEAGLGDDSVVGGAGADDLRGGAGNDTLAGGADNDTLTGGDGNDSLFGEDGDDTLYGNIGDDHLEGGSGNDTLAGNGGDDLLYGGDGADTLMIHQSDGNDTLFGGESEGDSDLIGFASEVDGVNVVMTGDETGTITGTDINVTFSEIEALRLSLGNDVYDGSAASGPSNVQLQMGDDTAFGGSGDDSISGELGNDVIHGGAGNDIISGGDGADAFTFLVNEGDNTVYGGDSAGDTDVLDLRGIADGVTVVMDTETSGTATAEGLSVSFSGIEEILLSEGTSTIDRSAQSSDLTDTLDGGNDTFIGGSGSETIYGGNDADDISGGAGADQLWGDAGDDVVAGGADNDTMVGGDGNDTLMGDDGDDKLYGSAGDDQLEGGSGADLVYGDVGNDTLLGDDGADKLYGGTGNDDLQGGDGNDALYGGTDDDTLSGGAGNDYFEGQSGNDVLYGGDDRDTFRFFNGQGDNTVVGGEGGSDVDQLSLVSVSDDVNIVLTGNEAGTATSTNMTIQFSEIEDIRFGNGSDTYDASVRTTNINESFGAGNDTAFGGSGNDNLKGETGNDELSGGAGNDYFEGGAGNDALYGGDDVDVFRFFNGQGDNTVFGGEGGNDYDQLSLVSVSNDVNVVLTGNEAGTVTSTNMSIEFSEIEDFRFGNGSDTFDASVRTTNINESFGAGNDTVFGGSGNDYLQGNDGNDELTGGAGDDLLRGGPGDDIYYGGDGRDNMADLVGNNTIYGGEGGDDTEDYLTFYGGSNIVVTLADDESGVATGDGMTTAFYGIEKLNLSESSDVFDATLDTTDREMGLLRGDDTAYGGSGNDLYVGHDGNDEIHGNAGNDTLRGDAGDDTLYGGDGADILAIGSGTGSDTIFGGDGGADYDTLDLSASVDDVVGNVSVNVTLTGDEAGTAEVSTVDEGAVEAGGTTVQFAGIEGYILGSLDDSFDGSVATQSLVVDSLSGNDTIFGGHAGDTITQLEGDSNLHGNGGDDTIVAGAGNDTVFGGDGGDTISFLINEGDNTVYGGDSVGDTDVLDLTGIADGVTVVMDTETSGTVTAEGLSVSFSGIEEIRLAEGASTIDRSALSSNTTTNLEGGNDTMFGGSGADKILGGAGDDVLHGNAGNDSIWGQAGQDTLYGGDGNDAFDLRGGEDDNTVFGGEGGSDIDTLLFVSSADAVTVTMTGDEAGTATTTGTTVTFAEIEQTKLSNYDDSLDGTALTSNATVEGRAGDDTLTLGSGDDKIQGDYGNDTLDGGAGNDRILGNVGDDVLHGDEGDDRLEGGSGNDLIYGGQGNDSIQPWSGNDTVYGGEGSDYFDIRANNGDNTIFGGGGDGDNDYLHLAGVGGGGVSVTMTGDEAGTATGDGVTVTFEEIERFKLTSGNDAVDATAKTADNSVNGLDGDDTLTLGSGNDRLEGWNGNDTLDGGGGNDGIWGQAGNDTIYGNTGDDGIYAGGGDDIVYGGEGNDHLRGEAGNDTLYGGDGDDEFVVRDGYGDQTIFGGDCGSNSDYINFFGMTTNMTVTLTSDGTGTATADGANATFEGIERFYMGQGDDVFDASATSAAVSGLGGSAGNDMIFGGSGNDSFGGGNGNDVVQGNGGDDSLTGGSGDDTVYGGDGADTITFLEDGGTNTVYGGDSAGDTDILDLSGIADGVTVVMDTETSGTATAGGLSVSFSGIEEIRLADGTSTIDRSALSSNATTSLEGGSDTFVGGAGNDLVTGGAGEDDISGGAGADQLFGGDGNDVLGGGAGNDTIEVGAGDDTVYGGDDRDLIKLSDNQGANTVFGGEGGVDGDTLSSWATSGINVTYTGDEAGILSAEGTTVTFSEIESVLATTSDDVYDASARTSNGGVSLSGGDDTAYGGSGNDVLKGEAGNDEILGNAGNDGLYGGLGDDTLYGGDDIDYLYVETGGGNDTLVGGEGGNDLDGLTFTGTTSGINLTFTSEEAGTATADGMNVTFSEIERVFINSGSNEDVIDASVTTSDRSYSSLGGGNDTFFGGSGRDIVNAGGEDDVLYGGSGNDALSGNAGNDALTGGAGSDALTGNRGDDLMFGGDDRDFFGFYQGDGNDTIFGGEGGDDVDQLAVQNVSGGVTITLTGDEAGGLSGDGLTVTFEGIEDYRFGAGNDTFDATVKSTNINETFGAGDDTVYGGSGNDALSGNAGNDALTGGAGSDALTGGAGDDLMYGGDDRDFFGLYNGDGNDTIFGGEGGDDVDQLAVQNVAGGVTITLTGDEAGSLSGDGLTVTFKGIEDYRFGAGNDTFDATVKTTSINESFGAGDDTVYGGSGDDVVNGQDGNDELYGNDGDDVLIGAGGDDTAYGGDGNDIVESYLNSGNDTYFGGENEGDEDVLILKGSGADGITVVFDDSESGTATGLGSNAEFAEFEKVLTASGNDTIDASATTTGVNVSLGEGDDTFVGGSGNDTVTGNLGDDTYFGGDGSDVFVLGEGIGNDSIHGGDGGDDEDLLDFAGVTKDLSVILTKDEGGTASTDGTNITFEGIEQFSLGYGDDVFDASASNAPITGGYGNAGNDSLVGGSGGDSLYGGADADSLSGGRGDDTLFGGDDADVFTVQSGDGADTVYGGEGGVDLDMLDLTGLTDGADVVMSGEEAGTVSGAGSTVDFSGIEVFDLTAGDDSFDGSAMIEGASLAMKTGNDAFLGGAGDDSVFGGLGDDTLSGGKGADTISGDVGNDTIVISEGDSVDGAAGDDIFILEDLGEAGTGDITVRGGVSEETTGDVLKLGFGADWSTLTITDDDVLTGKSGTVLLDDGSLLTFSEIETIICFTSGTRITTPMGLRPVEDLRPGDLVLTRDHGLQPVRWAGKRTVPGRGKLAPIRLRKGLIAGQQADLIVSPQHRVLMQGHRAQMYFGESEVLVAAKHLLIDDRVLREDCEAVTYVHILFDQHEVILAEGAPTESFHPGQLGLDGIDEAAREELFMIFPELRTNPNGFGKAARQSLKSFEAQLLLG